MLNSSGGGVFRLGKALKGLPACLPVFLPSFLPFRLSVFCWYLKCSFVCGYTHAVARV